MNLRTQEKGISLLFVIIIMSVILAIGAGISTIFIQEGKMMVEVGYSVIAFYAADAGIESALIADNPESPLVGDLGDGVGYIVYIKCGTDLDDCPADPSCDALNYCMKSIGSYKTVKRAIEIKY